MTTTVAPSETDASAPVSRWQRWEAALGDRLNPILVKEARQGFKSRMFVLTFFAALLFAWGWSVLGIALADPVLENTGSGAGMFFGYMLILAFPLVIIVPVGAYRSLVSEWDDATYELMSITALDAGHIARGKLASSLLQVVLYVSVFLPCIGFTYLLGGVSLPTMAASLLLVSCASVFATQLGLCLATLTRSRGMQVFTSVGFIVALLWLYWMVMAATFGLMMELGGVTSTSVFWYVVAVGLAVLGAYGWVFYQATRARLMFSSENRSTALRLALLVPPALWLAGWVPFLNEFSSEEEALLVLVPVFIHWATVLVLIGGERGEVSQRVRRRVPRSFLGRMLITWLLPGPTLGYFYVLLSVLGTVFPWLVVLFTHPDGRLSPREQETVLATAATLWGHLAIYGGIAAGVLRLARRYVVSNFVLSVAVMFTLVVLFCVVPVFIEVFTATGIPFVRYRLIHLLNPGVTGVAVAEQTSQTPRILTLLGVLGLGCMIWNFPAACREMVLLFQQTPLALGAGVSQQTSSEPEHPFEELLASRSGGSPASAPPASQ